MLAVDLPRPSPADIADHQLQCAADRAIGAVALAQRIAFGIHTDAAPNGAVDDKDRPDKDRRRQDPVHRETLVEHRLDRG